jgi:biotin transporter BioY
MGAYLRQAYVLPFILCAPLAAVLLLMQRRIVPHSYRQLILQIMIGGLVYGLCLGWAYLSNRALHTGDLFTPAASMQLGPVTPGMEGISEDA